MEKELNTITTAISIRESLLMACHKALDNTLGLTEASIAVTSSKAIEMDMAFGQTRSQVDKITKDTIC